MKEKPIAETLVMYGELGSQHHINDLLNAGWVFDYYGESIAILQKYEKGDKSNAQHL